MSFPFPDITEGQAILGGSALGAIGGLASGAFNYGLNTAAASKANDRSKNWATRHHLYERIALEAAGYNPILAMTQGKTGSNMRAPQAAPTNATMQMAQGAALGAQAKLNMAQAEQAISAADLNNVTAQLKDMEKPYANLAAEFWQTEAGKRSFRDLMLKRTMPDNLGQALYKWAVDYARNNPDAPGSPAEWIRLIFRETLNMLKDLQTGANIPPPAGPSWGTRLFGASPSWGGETPGERNARMLRNRRDWENYDEPPRNYRYEFGP